MRKSSEGQRIVVFYLFSIFQLIYGSQRLLLTAVLHPLPLYIYKKKLRQKHKKKCLKGSRKKNKQAIPNFCFWQEINQCLFKDALIYLRGKHKPENGGENRRLSGWHGCWSVSFGLLSVIGQRSWHQALWGALPPAHLLLSCLHFFVPVKPLFFSALFSICQSNRGRSDAPRSFLLLHSPSGFSFEPNGTLPLRHYSDSIQSRLFIQYWQGRAMLTVGVKAYINGIKHAHTRHSKCWFWRTVTIAHRLNKLFVGDWPRGSGCRSEASREDNRNSGKLGFPNRSLH